MTNYEKMKAYEVRASDEECIAIVFAETAGKAKYYAFSHMDYFCEQDYCELFAHRVPLIDKYYQKGKKEMDWMNPKDRLALVKELGLHCITDTVDITECQKCEAKNYCDVFEEYSEILREVSKLQTMSKLKI